MALETWHGYVAVRAPVCTLVDARFGEWEEVFYVDSYSIQPGAGNELGELVVLGRSYPPALAKAGTPAEVREAVQHRILPDDRTP